MAQDYKESLNMPSKKVDEKFPMRANLPTREPAMLEKWNEKGIYENLIKANEGKPLFVLHDGPPFSNGNIHMGTAMNKVLKDFIVRYKNMAGFKSPYVPGWDNHGMPIESAIIKQNKLNRKEMSIPQFREACHEFAQNFVNIQREQFKRLGVLGEWDNPYLTMAPKFEATEVKVFGEMFKKGYIYKGLKPVYWCTYDETALAEAEIEYADDKCTSIYVKFAVKNDNGKLAGYDLKNTYFIIWTTTTWTLPGNVAIALNPYESYALVSANNGENYIVAEALAEKTMKAGGIESYEILTRFEGRELEFMTAQHPFLDRESVVVNADYVTMDSGTGCVHTAPGFGADDYQTCRKYNIDLIVPVDDKGYQTAEAGKFAGLFYAESNKAILDDMTESGALFASEEIVHQYPHCWRCKRPIIFRATPQWFCSVDAFKDDAVKACENVQWLPAWGGDRITQMIKDRADWCISRQRHWGLPIPVLYCDTCKKPICTDETIEKISALFAERGSNAWFELEADEIAPKGYKCPYCGGTHFYKESDTLDGWFDSGSSHFATLTEERNLPWPADVYLEGADQYRGWFQSSLLTAVGAKGQGAPYKTVLTHGWVVDGEGKAMHKSLGNAIAPEEIIAKYGADVLRLWVASSDYHADVRVSEEIFKQLSQAYLKIRNTARYILGNIDDFNPKTDMVPANELEELDAWALTRLADIIQKCTKAYDEYEFYNVFHAVHNFCVVDLSNFYLDVLKDRLYCEGKKSALRRSAQSAMYLILDALTRLIAPILAFTAEEIWGAMPHNGESELSVLLAGMPKMPENLRAVDAKKWDTVLAVREDVKKALEIARADKLIGKPLEADVKLYCDGELYDSLKVVESELATLFITSCVDVVKGEGGAHKGENVEGLGVSVEHAANGQCERCWRFDSTVGENAEHATLCKRCVSVVESL